MDVVLLLLLCAILALCSLVPSGQACHIDGMLCSCCFLFLLICCSFLGLCSLCLIHTLWILSSLFLCSCCILLCCSFLCCLCRILCSVLYSSTCLCFCFPCSCLFLFLCLCSFFLSSILICCQHPLVQLLHCSLFLLLKSIPRRLKSSCSSPG